MLIGKNIVITFEKVLKDYFEILLLTLKLLIT